MSTLGASLPGCFRSRSLNAHVGSDADPDSDGDVALDVFVDVTIVISANLRTHANKIAPDLPTLARFE